MSAKVFRCSRCDRRLRNPARSDWVVYCKQGRIDHVICTDCSTPLELAGSAVRDATMDVGLSGGLYVTRPKVRVGIGI